MSALEPDRVRPAVMPAVVRCLVLGTVALTCMVSCSQGQEETSSSRAAYDHGLQATSSSPVSFRPVPEEYQGGEERFAALCAGCHGMAGRGTDVGPPLVHKIYEPSHHADVAFMRAVAQGVRAHHWAFGNMPNVTGATPGDVETIIPYVRWLQREAGIS